MLPLQIQESSIKPRYPATSASSNGRLLLYPAKKSSRLEWVVRIGPPESLAAVPLSYQGPKRQVQMEPVARIKMQQMHPIAVVQPMVIWFGLVSKIYLFFDKLEWTWRLWPIGAYQFVRRNGNLVFYLFNSRGLLALIDDELFSRPLWLFVLWRVLLLMLLRMDQ